MDVLTRPRQNLALLGINTIYKSSAIRFSIKLFWLISIFYTVIPQVNSRSVYVLNQHSFCNFSLIQFSFILINLNDLTKAMAVSSPAITSLANTLKFIILWKHEFLIKHLTDALENYKRNGKLDWTDNKVFQKSK